MDLRCYLFLITVVTVKLQFAACFINCGNFFLKRNIRPFRKEVIKMLNEIQSPTICVWSSHRLEYEDFDLPKRFSQRYKAVVSVGSLPVESIPGVCLHNVILSGRRDCSGLLSPTLPLSVLHHFYTLVEADMTQAAVDQCSAQFGYARAVLVSLTEARVFLLSSPFFPPRRFVYSELTSVLEKLYLKERNFKGAKINIATFHKPPFVDFVKENHTDLSEITGNEWEIVKTLSNLYNFTINLVTLKGGGRWGYVVNGTASGGISQALAEHDADIGVCNIWIVLARYAIMDFGPPLNEVTFTYIVPRPQLIPHQWQSLVNIFRIKMWLCTLAMYTFTTFCYWLFGNIDSNKTNVSPTESVLTMYGMLMLTSWSARIYNSSSRQLVTWWSLLALLLTTMYSSSIVARLTLPKYETRIDTVQQLVELGFHWYDSSYPSNDKWSIYFNPTNNWQSQFELKFSPLTREEILPALLSRKFAFPIQRWGGSFMNFNAEGLDYDHDLEGMRVMKETTDATYVSLGFAKRSPFFHLFKGPLLWMYQAGLPTHWTSHAVRTSVPSYNKRLLRETDDVNTQQLRTLAMDNLLPAFCVLSFGLFNSLLLFLAEIMYYKYQRDNRISVHSSVGGYITLYR